MKIWLLAYCDYEEQDYMILDHNPSQEEIDNFNGSGFGGDKYVREVELTEILNKSLSNSVGALYELRKAMNE